MVTLNHLCTRLGGNGNPLAYLLSTRTNVRGGDLPLLMNGRGSLKWQGSPGHMAVAWGNGLAAGGAVWVCLVRCRGANLDLVLEAQAALGTRPTPLPRGGRPLEAAAAAAKEDLQCHRRGTALTRPMECVAAGTTDTRGTCTTPTRSLAGKSGRGLFGTATDTGGSFRTQRKHFGFPPVGRATQTRGGSWVESAMQGTVLDNG